MAVGDLVTTDLQFEFSGVQFGGCCTGLDLDFLSGSGFDMPELRTSDVVRPRDHGMLAGADYFGGRTITIEVIVAAASKATLETKLLALSRMPMGGQTESQLVFQLPGQGKRYVNARLRRRGYPVEFGYANGRAVMIALQFFATDPRIYDLTGSTFSINLPVASGGLGWAVSWPVAWSTSTSGTVTYTNSGNFESRPVVTFTGPLTSPSIQNVTTGLTWACNFDLQTGDTLVVDFMARTVLLNGTASRYSYVLPTSSWWVLVPGANQLRITASSGSGNASVAAHSAWM